MEEWFLRAVARHQSVGQENGVIAKMRPQFIRCDFLAGESVMTYDVLDWELNPQNMIHGGITSTGFDTSLGMLAHYYAYPYVLTTVNLSVSFLRPIRLGDGMVYHRIRDLREDADLSQKEMARLLNCSQQVYSNYELGQRDIPTEILIRLAKIHHTTTDYILGLTNRPEVPY